MTKRGPESQVPQEAISSTAPVAPAKEGAEPVPLQELTSDEQQFLRFLENPAVQEMIKKRVEILVAQQVEEELQKKKGLEGQTSPASQEVNRYDAALEQAKELVYQYTDLDPEEDFIDPRQVDTLATQLINDPLLPNLLKGEDPQAKLVRQGGSEHTPTTYIILQRPTASEAASQTKPKKEAASPKTVKEEEPPVIPPPETGENLQEQLKKVRAEREKEWPQGALPEKEATGVNNWKELASDFITKADIEEFPRELVADLASRFRGSKGTELIRALNDQTVRIVPLRNVEGKIIEYKLTPQQQEEKPAEIETGTADVMQLSLDEIIQEGQTEALAEHLLENPKAAQQFFKLTTYLTEKIALECLPEPQQLKKERTDARLASLIAVTKATKFLPEVEKALGRAALITTAEELKKTIHENERKKIAKEALGAYESSLQVLEQDTREVLAALEQELPEDRRLEVKTKDNLRLAEMPPATDIQPSTQAFAEALEYVQNLMTVVQHSSRKDYTQESAREDLAVLGQLERALESVIETYTQAEEVEAMHALELAKVATLDETQAIRLVEKALRNDLVPLLKHENAARAVNLLQEQAKQKIVPMLTEFFETHPERLATGEGLIKKKALEQAQHAAEVCQINRFGPVKEGEGKAGYKADYQTSSLLFMENLAAEAIKGPGVEKKHALIIAEDFISWLAARETADEIAERRATPAQRALATALFIVRETEKGKKVDPGHIEELTRAMGIAYKRWQEELGSKASKTAPEPAY
ncbi:hypothetical protein B5M47_03195 [candidate division CPR3 bacterium 4484_211]|uniref:Uncharacterized protein n=1 Tax=candidate division CPR3 bacterium 4484_211 TaxID=1968527 RepID=A0A1W9NZ09_UNCC3|nr:MAG: hypothetical protein B5M47_03195 [candidate division CPR3 bacterium 4484_211]